MPTFLSRDWFAANAAPMPAPDPSLAVTIEQHVRDTPDGETIYAVRVRDGEMTVSHGPAPDADVRLETDYETAVAIHEGRVSLHDALVAGRIKFTGNLTRLIAGDDA